MESTTRSTRIHVDTGTGIFWFIGWLFTNAFAKLVWGEGLLGRVVWPSFRGGAVRWAARDPSQLSRPVMVPPESRESCRTALVRHG